MKRTVKELTIRFGARFVLMSYLIGLFPLFLFCGQQIKIELSCYGILNTKLAPASTI